MSKTGDFEWPPRSSDLAAPSQQVKDPKRTENQHRQELVTIFAEALVKTLENAARRSLKRSNFQKILNIQMKPYQTSLYL